MTLLQYMWMTNVTPLCTNAGLPWQHKSLWVVVGRGAKLTSYERLLFSPLSWGWCSLCSPLCFAFILLNYFSTYLFIKKKNIDVLVPLLPSGRLSDPNGEEATPVWDNPALCSTPSDYSLNVLMWSRLHKEMQIQGTLRWNNFGDVFCKMGFAPLASRNASILPRLYDFALWTSVQSLAGEGQNSHEIDCGHSKLPSSCMWTTTWKNNAETTLPIHLTELNGWLWSYSTDDFSVYIQLHLRFWPACSKNACIFTLLLVCWVCIAHLLSKITDRSAFNSE